MNVLEMIADILEDSPAISPCSPTVSPVDSLTSKGFLPLSPLSPALKAHTMTPKVSFSNTCWDCLYMDKSGVLFPGLCKLNGEVLKSKIVDTGCQSFAPLLARAMGYGCAGCHCKTYLRTPAGWRCEGCGFVFEVIGGTVGPMPIH